ncbi:hypothetical protein [Paenibacillus sp. SI8]|uniref:hypothetical protein n=1 Tax=unclassified Paenibacillus TaxID=185978 RepID=UPI0034675FC6
MKGKVAELQFMDQGRFVLEKIDTIYRQEFKIGGFVQLNCEIQMEFARIAIFLKLTVTDVVALTETIV